VHNHSDSLSESEEDSEYEDESAPESESESDLDSDSGELLEELPTQKPVSCRRHAFDADGTAVDATDSNTNALGRARYGAKWSEVDKEVVEEQRAFKEQRRAARTNAVLGGPPLPNSRAATTAVAVVREASGKASGGPGERSTEENQATGEGRCAADAAGTGAPELGAKPGSVVPVINLVEDTFEDLMSQLLGLTAGLTAGAARHTDLTGADNTPKLLAVLLQMKDISITAAMVEEHRTELKVFKRLKKYRNSAEVRHANKEVMKRLRLVHSQGQASSDDTSAREPKRKRTISSSGGGEAEVVSTPSAPRRVSASAVRRQPDPMFDVMVVELPTKKERTCYRCRKVVCGRACVNFTGRSLLFEKTMKEVTRKGLYLMHAHSLQADHEIVQAAVRQAGAALEYASLTLQRNREIVLDAVAKDGRALQWAAAELQADKDVVLKAVSATGAAMLYADVSLKASLEFVMDAVRIDGHALKYAAPTLRANSSVVLAAVQQTAEAIQHAAAARKADRGFLMAVVAMGACTFAESESIRKEAEAEIEIAKAFNVAKAAKDAARARRGWQLSQRLAKAAELATLAQHAEPSKRMVLSSPQIQKWEVRTEEAAKMQGWEVAEISTDDDGHDDDNDESDDDEDEDEDGYNAEWFSEWYGWYKDGLGWHKDRDIKQEPTTDATPHQGYKCSVCRWVFHGRNYSGSDHATQNAQAERARDNHESSQSGRCRHRGRKIAKKMAEKKRGRKERRRERKRQKLLLEQIGDDY
jgi:hypothetical protein